MKKNIFIIVVKILLTIVVAAISFYTMMLSLLILSAIVHPVFAWLGTIILPSLLLPMIWLKKRKRFVLIWSILIGVYLISMGINYAIVEYDKSITINTAPNINIHEYLPFEEESKIVKYDSKTLKLADNLPRIDGAAALFPVYSAFVNAVYPNTTEIYDGIFHYNNTPGGYQLLAE